MRLEPVTTIELDRAPTGWAGRAAVNALLAAPSGAATAAEAPLLEVNNIEVVYNDVILVLRGLSLAVPKGRIVALLGANGAGKSTTLKAISGLLQDRGGRGHARRHPLRRGAHRRHRPAPDRPARASSR